MYLIESYYGSPLFITHPRPVGYVRTLKEAKSVCEKKNKASIRNQYSYTKLKEIK